MRIFFFLALFLNTLWLFGQYQFSGEVSKEHSGKPMYLSLVEDYRKSTRIYLDQIIQRTLVDSTGVFRFEGDNLLDQNRMYRIHLDNCSEGTGAEHFLGVCDKSESVLFIANNKDTLNLPTSFEDQPLCTIVSTNSKASLLLDIDALKEEMAFSFMDFPSEAKKKLDLKKWFATLHDFGVSCDEPLVELYIFDFLSDRRNETYGYYLKDVAENNYYLGLSDRLETSYPNTDFTNQYNAEITVDQQLASFSNAKPFNWTWILGALLLTSILINVYLLVARRKSIIQKNTVLWQKLTQQEQKIVEHILDDKSNKEIASTLFVSHSTVKTHINNLYKKLEVSSREEVEALFGK